MWQICKSLPWFQSRGVLADMGTVGSLSRSISFDWITIITLSKRPTSIWSMMLVILFVSFKTLFVVILFFKVS
jgi:hypothetical protein